MNTEKLHAKYRALRYRWSGRELFADLFAKTWMEPAIPFTVLAILVVGFSVAIKGYFSVYNFDTTSRAFAEFAFVAFGMGLSLVSGGIDLSVGSIFALTNLTALICFGLIGLPLWVSILATLLVGVILGAINGVFIGIIRTRPFLTTLVTLLVYKGIYNLITVVYGPAIASGGVTSSGWEFMGQGSLFHVPTSFVVLVIIGVACHILLSRTRWGWHLLAVGASRRSARHAGISVKRALFFTYVLSGAFTAIGGLFFATRLQNTGGDVGDGLAFLTLSAVMVGGLSLAGGKGSVGRVLIGAGIMFLVTDGIVRLGFPGQVTTGINGAILLVAVGLDSKWLKNRGKAVEKSYVNPTYRVYGTLPETGKGSGSPYAMTDRLVGAEAIGLGEVEGPEDIILDRQGRLYTGDRRGWILRFSGPNFEKLERFARTGGRPLGLAFDKDDNLIVCVSGMGLYGVRPSGEVFKLTDETNRSWFKLVDDSRLRLTDDLDIAPDGTIYFSEGTTRFDLDRWAVDGLEGRGSGRLVAYSPRTGRTRTLIKNVMFCNGVCVSHDGQSVLYCETFGMRLMRYWIDGPKRGQIEVVIGNLPGAPDNINRASDGGYWLALAGMRVPVCDLAMQFPKFRMHMIKRLPVDEWLIQGMNNGCIVKLDRNAKPVTSYWDPTGEAHPNITSMREDRGFLYIGGLDNNRIGRIKLANVDSNWVSSVCYWGQT